VLRALAWARRPATFVHSHPRLSMPALSFNCRFHSHCEGCDGWHRTAEIQTPKRMLNIYTVMVVTGVVTQNTQLCVFAGWRERRSHPRDQTAQRPSHLHQAEPAVRHCSFFGQQRHVGVLEPKSGLGCAMIRFRFPQFGVRFRIHSVASVSYPQCCFQATRRLP
jgi:hypothetical protein